MQPAAPTAPPPGPQVLTVPNLLSVLRLLLVPAFLALVVSGRDGWAFAVLVASGCSDYLDGLLARRWNQTTRLGRILDPAADRLFIVSTLIGLALRDLVPWWLVAVIIARDVALTATVPVLARHGFTTLPVHYLGKAATFCLLIGFPLVLLSEVPAAPVPPALALGWAFTWWGAALYWWAGLLYLRQVRALTRGPLAPAPAPPTSVVRR